MEKEKMVIIDGSSLIYRAFYALPDFTTKDGIYTNGVYGFLNMFYRVIEDEKPDYIAVVLDRSGPTFRHEEYEDYKANRKKTPNELSSQFPILRELLNILNIKYLEESRYEADDLAGSLARLGEKEGKEVILVTGDRDYLQLASHDTKVMLTIKGINETALYDYDRVVEEYGMTPSQYIDYMGLMGDPSDNIPGVPGIGKKRGADLIKEFGSIEGVYKNIDKISGKKMKENLIENKDLAIMSKMLATIVTSLPIKEELDDFRLREPNKEELISFYKRLEFNSFLDRLNLSDRELLEGEELKEFKEIKEEDLDYFIEKLRESKAFSFKFVVEEDDYLEGNGKYLFIRLAQGGLYIINLREIKIENFKEIFEDENVEKSGHGLKKDIVFLLRNSIELKGLKNDSLIGSYILDPGRSSYEISDLAENYLKKSYLREEELLGKGVKKKTYSQVKKEDLFKYMSFYLDTVGETSSQICKEIEEEGMLDLYREIELPLIQVLASMEYLGFKVDEEELDKLGLEFSEKIQETSQEIYKLAGREFNINSPKQLGEILFEDLGLEVIKKTKTGYSTNREVLDQLLESHEIISHIIDYRELSKLKSTYIDGLKEEIGSDGRIHSNFNQTVTTTGRISSTEPNLQNIPIRSEAGRMIRKAFVAEEGCLLVDGDYSQIELRVLAHISGDENFIQGFIEGEDVHTRTASQVFHRDIDQIGSDLRDRAKAVNFGIVYGISDYGLSRDLKISRQEAKDYIDKYLDYYKGVKNYMEDIVEEGKENGYVETIFKRRRYIPELKSRNFNIRSFGERVALNTPIQGSAADIIKKAMIEVDRSLKEAGFKSRLILQIHDELIVETYLEEKEEVIKLLRETMEGICNLRVPLVANILAGESWYETH